jgi:putative membrane-bound dehydrogenase-like protein
MRSFCYERRLAWIHRLVYRIALLALVSISNPAAQSADPLSIKSPLSPEDSLKAFRLAPGLKIEIVAAEPEVVSPVSIAFDEQGRLWVVEMSDYPNGPVPGEPPKSRIKLLEDRDGDGRFETAHVFADKLLFVTGVQPWRGGVIATLAGEIAYFKDTDDDQRADVRETWFRGFAQENPQLRANHPRFALDHHIYVANGLKGGTIVANKEVWGREMPAVSISGKDFRFDPLTGECDAVSGNGQFGLTFDDFGNRFVCSNRNPCRHIVLEDRYLKRNPFLAVRDVAQDVSPPAEKSRIVPISRAWTTSNLHAGQFTAACGVTIYRGDALPGEFYGNSFVCEPTGNLVHRDILEPDGATFKSHYASGDVEFLASPDEWFRPVDLANGPDGALYVVDMYRAVIEHPEWVPVELKNRPDLYDGSDRGRIYRIVATDRNIPSDRRGPLNLGSLSSRELAALIAHLNAWHRETAARLIFETRAVTAVSDLEEIVRSDSAPAPSRVLGLHVLEGLGELSDELREIVAIDNDVLVRGAAYELSESRLNSLRAVKEEALRDTACVSVHLAAFLGELVDDNVYGEQAQRKLADILVTRLGDEWIRRAALIAAGPNWRSVYQILAEVSEHPQFQKDDPHLWKYRELVREIYEQLGVQNEEQNMLPAVGMTVSPRLERVEANDVAMLGFVAFNGLGRGFARRGASLRAALADSQMKDGRVSVFFEIAQDVAADSKAALEHRREAIETLRYSPTGSACTKLIEVATTDALQEIRLAAIDSLAMRDDPQIAPALLAGSPSQTPVVRRRIMNAMIRSPVRTKELLGAIDAKQLSVLEIDAASVQTLINHKDESIREQARKLLAAAVPAERKQVLEAYQTALALKADPRRGRAVFEKNCANCHKIGDLGVDVAPDISDSRTKTPAQLLTDILNPNQAIDNNYVSYTVLTKDGKAETGIVATETATSITLRQPEGKTVLILRQEIEELRSNGVSLMPEGLEKNVSVEQMADLISFIKNWRYLDGSVPLGK